METLFDLCALIQKGGVYAEIDGSSAKEVYSNLSKIVNLPASCTPEVFCAELSSREEILSTAVGNGIAIPHPKRPILEHEEDQRIIVCYPKEPLNMNAPDSRKVYVMFIILSQSGKFHLEALSSLAKVLKSDSFQKLLELKPGKDKLVELIKNSVF